MPIKDIILLSACLSGHLVRYNGTDKSCSSDLLQHWREEGRLVTHCPDLAAWLALKTAQSQGGIENPRVLGSILSPGTTI